MGKLYVLFEKVINPEFIKLVKCKHPKRFRELYHDGAILCRGCMCIISQFGEDIEKPSPLVGNMPSEFILKEADKDKFIKEILTIYENLKSHDAGQEGIENTPGNKAYINYKVGQIKKILK